MKDQEIISYVASRLRAEFGDSLLGVLAGGSRVRGEAHANSDLDMVAVIETLKRRRVNVVIADVEVELLINPPQSIRTSFQQERKTGRSETAHLLSTGQVVYDPKGVLLELMAEAAAVYEAGPPPFSAQEEWRSRSTTANILGDIADLQDIDEQQGSFLVGLLLPQLIHFHYRIARRWLKKAKRVLKDLETWDDTAARLAREASAGPFNSRHAAVRGLADHVFAKYGGPMPRAWMTDWEVVAPTGSAASSVAQKRGTLDQQN